MTRAVTLERVLQIFSGQVFTNVLIELDDTHFVDCTLIGCTLQYSGKPLVLERTEFSGCRFLFIGDAGRMLNFLECFGMIDPLQHSLVTSLGVVN